MKNEDDASESPSGPAPIRVLIADDHALFREGLRALLLAVPGIVCAGEAATGAEAIDQAKRLQPDVVLMDISMPGLSGIQALRHILADRPRTGVIMVTMLEDDASVFAAMRAGARGYVLKGANHEEMLQAIRAVAQGQALFGPAIAARMVTYFGRAQPTGNPQLDGLTEREREVLALVAQHRTNAEIAQHLSLSQKTIRNYISTILDKLQAVDRAEAIQKARESGLM